MLFACYNRDILFRLLFGKLYGIQIILIFRLCFGDGTLSNCGGMDEKGEIKYGVWRVESGVMDNFFIKFSPQLHTSH